MQQVLTVQVGQSTCNLLCGCPAAERLWTRQQDMGAYAASPDCVAKLRQPQPPVQLPCSNELL